MSNFGKIKYARATLVIRHVLASVLYAVHG